MGIGLHELLLLGGAILLLVSLNWLLVSCAVLLRRALAGCIAVLFLLVCLAAALEHVTQPPNRQAT